MHVPNTILTPLLVLRIGVNFSSIAYTLTQVCKEWKLDNEFNDAMRNRVKIVHETISSSYQASLQIDWTPDVLQEHTVLKIGLIGRLIG